jgi:hypothetical protein
LHQRYACIFLTINNIEPDTIQVILVCRKILHTSVTEPLFITLFVGYIY